MKNIIELLITWSTTLISGIAFWFGIIAPVVYLPLLFKGVRTKNQLTLITLLIGVNFLAFYFGHAHRDSSRSVFTSNTDP